MDFLDSKNDGRLDGYRFEKFTCPICGNEEAGKRPLNSPFQLKFICPTCIEFIIHDITCVESFRNRINLVREHVSKYVADYYNNNHKIPIEIYFSDKTLNGDNQISITELLDMFEEKENIKDN